MISSSGTMRDLGEENRMLTFATSGPAGSNHEFVTERYLAFHGVEAANVVLIADFDDALRLLADGAADFVVQVAVHPAATDTVAKAHFEHGIRVIDTFISPSRPLGVLTRGIPAPKKSWLTTGDKDLSQYGTVGEAGAGSVNLDRRRGIAGGAFRQRRDSAFLYAGTPR